MRRFEGAIFKVFTVIYVSLYTYIERENEQCKKVNNQHFYSEIISRITTTRSWILIKYKQQCKIKNQLEVHWFASF